MARSDRRMALDQCSSPSTNLIKPSGLSFTNISGETEPPFELKGGPLNGKPNPIKGFTETKKFDPLKNTNTPSSSENYYDIKLNTENILKKDSNTTLRYEGLTFNHEFTAIHQNIWGLSGDGQVSMVFRNPEKGYFFHICIPIALVDTSEDENIFLKYWIYKNISEKVPSNFTMNELLNFRETDNEDVKFATIQYCLTYNNTENKTYVVCLFNNPLKINKNNVSSWFTETLKITTPPVESRKKTINSILNLLFAGTFINTTDRKLLSTSEYFSGSETTIIVPTYYNVSSKQIGGTLFKKKYKLDKGIRGLDNIKCYPIDLVNQIDEDGNIIINEDNNKPIDIESVRNPEKGEIDPITTAKVKQEEKEPGNNLYFILFIVFISLFGLLILFLIYYFLRGKSSQVGGGSIIRIARG
jgi:hypothetical protein